jgi:putative flippase GtrA
MDHAELFRYVINGIVATAIHFIALTLNVEFLGIDSAGISNFLAAICGITASFLGSRYFVFRGHRSSILNQAALFVLLYFLIAIIHGLILFFWTDVYGHDYRIGFLIATFVQVIISYTGNKFWVFNR